MAHLHSVEPVLSSHGTKACMAPANHDLWAMYVRTAFAGRSGSDFVLHTSLLEPRGSSSALLTQDFTSSSPLRLFLAEYFCKHMVGVCSRCRAIGIRVAGCRMQPLCI